MPHGPPWDPGAFGIQLIAVFSARFSELLSPGEQLLHLASIALVACAVALVMTPAAYHRQMGLQEVSEEFMAIAARVLLWSMFPLMLGIVLDFYLIGRVLLHNRAVSLLLSTALLAFFVLLWFVLPRLRTLRNAVNGHR